MAYKLTLTHTERRAFDWVGFRYNSGDIGRLLFLECCPEDAEWSEPGDITFTIPEHIAWEIRDLAEEENCGWPCFCTALRDKLNEFLETIV